MKPALETASVPHDPDDPALWIPENDATRTLILATDKMEKVGGLFVFGLDGRLRQTIGPLDRPNNVDVEYGFPLGDRRIDIAVLTERRRHRLRVFEIPADGGDLIDLVPEGLPVLADERGEAGEPMGIALYRRPRDGAVFAIISPKRGGTTDYLWQYRLESDGTSVKATFARRFGAFSGVGPDPGQAGEIEAVVVDDQLGYVYYADEKFGIRKWHADPDAMGADVELAVFGRDGYQGDREGLALHQQAGDSGFLLSSDQVEGSTRLHIYPRKGSPGRPHAHPRVAVVLTSADESDGIEVTSRPLPGFPSGLLVIMNSGARNFQIYRWEDVARVIPE